MIAVPSLSLVVCAPHQASGVKASVPYASDVQRESNPRRSASAIASTTPSGGPRLNGSISSPSFITHLHATVAHKRGAAHLPGGKDSSVAGAASIVTADGAARKGPAACHVQRWTPTVRLKRFPAARVRPHTPPLLCRERDE